MGLARVVGHTLLERFTVPVTVGALLFAMRFVSEFDFVCEQPGKVIDRVVCACVTVRTIKCVVGILVYFVANGTQLVVRHAAFGRPHTMTVRASHSLLLEMLLMGELESPVCADLRLDLGTGLRTGLRTGPRAGLPNGPQAHEHNQPPLDSSTFLGCGRVSRPAHAMDRRSPFSAIRFALC